MRRMDRNEGEEARREVVRSIERKEGVVVRMTEEGGRELVRRRMEKERER